LHAVVENLADSVIITDRSGTIQYVNPAFEETTGYTSEEAVGRTPRILKSGEHDRALYEKMWSTILVGEPFKGSLVNRKKNGDLYHAEQTITPIKDARGSITHFVSIVKDLTERKRTEAQDAEIRFARIVQKRLYPGSDPTIEGFDIAGGAFPAGVLCGDCFDYVPMLEDQLGIVIGDVCGHGFGPAVRMAEVRAYLRAYARMHADADEILGLLNKDLMTRVEERLFVTMMLVRIDPGTRSFVYANAGHPSGYLIDAAGVVKAELESTGTPLGLFADSVFPSSPAIPITPGDLLVLVTDGIMDCEAPDGKVFGTTGLLDVLGAHRGEPARRIVAALYDAAVRFAGNRPLPDDVTLIVCKACFD
jgi:PAS domain S-box-containing protein